MRIVLNRTLVHRCPYKDEIDVGAVTIMFEGDAAPELYALSAYLDTFSTKALTHEQVTAQIAEHYEDLSGLSVTTEWTTAGIDVQVTVP